MSNLPKNFTILFASLTIISVLIIQSLFGASMITDAIVQARWCEATNAICLLEVYFWSSIVILGAGIILQLLWNSTNKKKALDQLYINKIPKGINNKAALEKDTQAQNNIIQPKIQTIGVIEPRKENRGYRLVKIQVTNVGESNIKCIAKLIGVSRKDKKSGDKEEIINISKINPNGKFLKWDSSRSAISNLNTNVPDVVSVLISLREGYTYRDNMIFTFHDYDDVESIKPGDYNIAVAFLYSDGKQWKEFDVFEGMLRFNYKDIEWI